MISLSLTPTSSWYLILSAILFAIGTFGVLVRRNPLVMFMCIELMLNAVNLSFVALAREQRHKRANNRTFRDGCGCCRSCCWSWHHRFNYAQSISDDR